MEGSPVDVIVATVNGPYGQVLQESKDKVLNLYYNGGSNGAQSDYRMGENGSWVPIPEGGIVVPVDQGDYVQIRSVYQGEVAQECEKVPPETSVHAAFRFSWTQPKAPTVTIEVQENSIVQG